MLSLLVVANVWAFGVGNVDGVWQVAEADGDVHPAMVGRVQSFGIQCDEPGYPEFGRKPD